MTLCFFVINLSFGSSKGQKRQKTSSAGLPVYRVARSIFEADRYGKSISYYSLFQNCKIPFAKYSRKDCLQLVGSRFFIFYRKPKWHHLEVCICTFFSYANFQVVPFCFEKKIQNFISKSFRQSICEYFAKKNLQFWKKLWEEIEKPQRSTFKIDLATL